MLPFFSFLFISPVIAFHVNIQVSLANDVQSQYGEGKKKENDPPMRVEQIAEVDKTGLYSNSFQLDI